MRKKLLSILALLCLTVSGAWALDPLPGDDWDDDTKTLTVNSNPADYAYSYVSDIENLVISDAVTSIGDYAFYDCFGLTSIVVASGNTTYDSRENCNAIIETSSNTLIFGCKNTIIPNSVISIGNSAFKDCTGLTSVTIPNSVKSIDEQAFAGCTGLTSITIPNSVTSIGNSAFLGCTALTSITIPNSVTSIGNSAFLGCSGLTSVTNYAVTPQTINSNVFIGVTTSSCTLYVPEGSIDLYQAAEVWKDFGTKSAIPAAYTVTANLANGAYWATFYSNAGNYQAPVGTQVFKVALDGTGITLMEITDRIVNAGQGVVLKSSSASIELASAASGTTDEGGYSNNSLKGTMTVIETTGANDYYVLGGKNGAGFYKLSNTSGTIGANKAYLTYSGGGGAGAREFFLFDEATGIEMPTVEDVNADALVYDLQGRRVVNPTKGLYIVNGKKVFINK